MPELNFKITGDDSELKKTLANIAKVAKENGDQISKEVLKSTDVEVKSRDKVTKSVINQRNVTLEVVNSIEEEVKATNRSTEALSKKRKVFDELTGKQLKPVQIITSRFDEKIAKENSPAKGGLPVGAAEEINRATGEIIAYGNASGGVYKLATESATKHVEAVKKTTEALKEQRNTEESLKARLGTLNRGRADTINPGVIAEYNRRIQETQAEIAKLDNIGKRGYDALGNRIRATIGQKEILIKRLRYFQDQLNYAKAPQSFVTLNQKIQETEAQLNRLANAGKKGFDDLGNKIKETDTNANKLLGTLKSVGLAIAAAFSGQAIMQFLTESKELAARGEGIREAFSKLDDGKTLEMLRKATRGATSDIDLMAQALRAKNFQIGPDLLSKGLELAGKVSRQTGQDVTYLADSFVNGLGRKSLLILDNMQISQVQLRAEIKKTGDFQTAVGNVIDQKLLSMGEVAMTSADKMAKFTTRIANLKEMVGQKINFVFNYDALRDANKEFFETGVAVQKLQTNIPPLLTRYDELTAKAQKNGGITKLSKIEQTLLKDAIKQISDQIPSAITQFDKYGNAMAISTSRAKEFIEQQVLVLQALNEDRIGETTKRLGKLSRELSVLQDYADELAATGDIQIQTSVSAGTAGGVSQTIRKATEQEKQAYIDRLRVVSGEIAKYNALLESDSGSLISKRQKEIDEFQKITKTNEGADDEAIEKARKAKERQDAIDATALSAQESLHQRIQVLKDRFERDGLTKEQEARRAIVDEFKKLAFDIEQQARKYDAYAKKYGAARAMAVLGPKETTAQIEPIRKAAIEDLEYRQEVDRTKIDLEKQKALYADYEDYKTKLGQSAADARFGKELNAYITYFDILKAKQKEITDIAPEKRTGGQQDYLKWLEVELKATVEVEKKKNDALVKEFIAYSDKRKALTEKYEADVASLSGNASAQSERTTRYNEEISSLDDANVQKLDAYKVLFKGIENLSDESARKVIANAQSMLKTLVGQGKISKELADQIAKLIKDTSLSLKDRMPDRLINMANQIDVVAEAVSGVDDEFSKMLSTLGNVVGQVGNIKKGMADMQKAQVSGDGLGQLAAGLGIFGAAFSAFKGIAGMFGDLEAGAEQQAYARELQNKQTEALNKALERQVELLNEAYGTDKLDKYNAAILQSAENERKYQDQLKNRFLLTGDKQTDAMVEAVNAGSSLPGVSRDFVIKMLEKSGAVRLPQELEALQRLMDEGKLDAATEVIVANLIQAAKVSKDLANNLAADNIGSSLDSVADDFIKNLTDGTQDFEKSFEESIRKSIMNGFKGRLIEQQLQAFYTQFAQASSDGVTTPEEIETLRVAYIAASEKAKKDLEALGIATGVDLTDKGSTTSSLNKSITQITSDQANALEGISRGQYDQLKLLAMLQGTNNTIAQKQLDTAMQGLKWAELTAINTGETVVELKNVVTRLDKVVTNTASGSLRGAGLG